MGQSDTMHRTPREIVYKTLAVERQMTLFLRVALDPQPFAHRSAAVTSFCFHLALDLDLSLLIPDLDFALDLNPGVKPRDRP